jgi:hypothetical protein
VTVTAYIGSLASDGNHLVALPVSMVILDAVPFITDLLIERHPFFGRAFWVLVDSAMPSGLPGRLISRLGAWKSRSAL